MNSVLWLIALIMKSAMLVHAPLAWGAEIQQLYAAREHAFITDSAEAWQRVYDTSAVAAQADRQIVKRYRHHGLRFVRVQLRVLEVNVHRARDSTAIVDVTDHIATAEVSDSAGTTMTLPRDQPTSRRLHLQRGAEGWRITKIAPVPPQ